MLQGVLLGVRRMITTLEQVHIIVLLLHCALCVVLASYVLLVLDIEDIVHCSKFYVIIIENMPMTV